MAPSLTISRLAKATGVGIDTVRYYERNGLLPEPPRRASGYRAYREEDVQRLRFIRRAKQLGFSLEEIRGLLDLSAQNEQGVPGVHATAAARLAELDARIEELERVRNGLRQLVQACPGHGTPHECPILKALTGEAKTGDLS
ncbi:MAG TPA: heavy metal-responsive transcriptional regulator [Solimonas sp.]